MDMPKLSPIKGQRRWVLLEGYHFEGFRVPGGFEFDGASVPRFFHRVVTPHDPRVIRAALGHDYLYRQGVGGRKAADMFFRNVLISDGVPGWLATLMYQAVRMGGFVAWQG